jgi:hypothetical protein
MVFLVMSLFTIQVERGKAPIEKILPEAQDMPFYHVLNYPFADGVTSRQPPHVKPQEEMATQALERAA